MPRERRYARRSVIGSAIGVGGAVALAGCGQEDPTEPEDPTEQADGPADRSGPELTIAMAASNPNDLQWNKYFAQGSGAGNLFMYDPLAIPGRYPRGVDASDFPDWHQMVASDFAIDGATLTIELNDAYTWHDGDDLLAEDLLLQYRLEKAMGLRTGNVWEELQARDDRTLEFTLTNTNAEISLPQLLPLRARTKRGTKYQALYEAIESATTEEERQTAAGEVTTARIDNPVGTGLWKLQGTSSTQLTLTRHEGHPNADALNFDRLVLPAIPNNQKRWLGLREGTIDALVHASAPEQIEKGFPEHVERVPYVGSGGDCMLFNFDRAFDDRRVRQAIAFMINRWTNTHNAKDFVDTLRYPCGLPNDAVTEWVGENPEGFSQYGYESSKPQRAAQLLRDAGYTREDGAWYTPDGDRFTVQIISGSGGTWKLNNQTAARTLSDFGIDAIPKVTGGAAFGERKQNGEYDIAMGGWGPRQGGRHPYNYFSQEFSENTLGPQNVPMDPLEADVPYPVGDPDGEVQTVAVRERVRSLAQAESEEEKTALVRELAWIYNQWLPRLPLMNGVARRFLTRDEWEFPAKDSQWMVDNPVTNLMRMGKFTAKTG